MIISYLLFLVPITNGESVINTIWFGFWLCMFYAFYTLTMLTYYATFSEVCEDERATIFLSNTKSIFDVVYFSLGFALLPLFISFDINIRIIALAFLPLSLTMMIPMFLLKEKKNDENTEVRTLTLKKALKCSFQNKNYIFWLFTTSILTIGTQLFLGGINEGARQPLKAVDEVLVAEIDGEEVAREYMVPVRLVRDLKAVLN